MCFGFPDSAAGRQWHCLTVSCQGVSAQDSHNPVHSQSQAFSRLLVPHLPHTFCCMVILGAFQMDFCAISATSKVAFSPEFISLRVIYLSKR